MTAPAEAPPRPGAPGPDDGRFHTAWVVAGVVVMVAIALMWVWIFSGAPRKLNPDHLADRDWVERAEQTCAATQEGIDERTTSAGRQDTEARADAIDASTDDLEAMLGDLADPPPETDDDRALVEAWLADYDRLLEDRRTYVDAVRIDPDARFLTTEKFNDPLDRVVQTFAEVNDMPSCIPAGDVG